MNNGNNKILSWMNKTKGIIGIIVGLCAIGTFIVAQINSSAEFKAETTEMLKTHDKKIDHAEEKISKLEDSYYRQERAWIKLETYFEIIDPRRMAKADSVAIEKINNQNSTLSDSTKENENNL